MILKLALQNHTYIYILYIYMYNSNWRMWNHEQKIIILKIDSNRDFTFNQLALWFFINVNYNDVVIKLFFKILSEIKYI